MTILLLLNAIPFNIYHFTVVYVADATVMISKHIATTQSSHETTFLKSTNSIYSRQLSMGIIKNILMQQSFSFCSFKLTSKTVVKFK